MQQVPRVVRSDQLSDRTAQTPGFIRRAAIDHEMTGASLLAMFWFDDLGGPKRSAAHTHGEAETAVYCISGRQRVYYGEGFARYIEFGAGDFAFIPAELAHIEVNEWSEPCVCIGVRSPSNIVINLGDPVLPPNLAALPVPRPGDG